MEEKAGEMITATPHVSLQSEEGTMHFMRRLVFFLLLFMMSVSIAWADERGSCVRKKILLSVLRHPGKCSALDDCGIVHAPREWVRTGVGRLG